MNQENNNFNQINNENSNNQPLNPKPKKKKYWLIPVIILIIMIMSLLISFVPATLGYKFNIIMVLFLRIGTICGALLFPSIIIAIILSVSNKNK